MLLTEQEQKEYVNKNQRLIDFVIKKYFSYTGISRKRRSFFLMEYDDIFNEGMIGLIEAARKFDPTKEFTFSTFAVFYIRAHIQIGIANAGTRLMRFPTSVQDLRYHVYQLCENNNKDTLDLYKKGKLSFEQYVTLKTFLNLKRYVGLEDHNYAEFLVNENKDLLSIIKEDDERYCREIIWKLVRGCFKANRKRNYYIVCLRIGFGTKDVLDFREIAGIINKSKYKRKRTFNSQSVRRIFLAFVDHAQKVVKNKLQLKNVLSGFSNFTVKLMEK